MTRLALSFALLASLATASLAHRAPPPHIESYSEPQALMPRRALTREAVQHALAEARDRNLAAFRAYVKAGVFPSNVYKAGELNVWRDQDGHYCAAATLVRMSGQTALVAKVAEQNNFIRLADVQQGPLMDWILTSGFTQDEIVAIQKPFSPVTQHPQIEPAKPIVVDADLRKAEDARLRAKYAAVDKQIVAHARRSLELATDRLMKHPQLAWQLVSAARAGI
ncbi:MAG: hypothetical protein ACM31C_16640 [Acidobacteriota bacterium]